MTHLLSVRLLGGFFIQYDGKPVQGIDTPRLQSLLAYLLLHKDAPQPRSRLAFLFWPDTTEAQARTNLRNLLHSLRHALPEADYYLDIGLQTLQWRGDSLLTLDVADFEAALELAKQAQQRNDSNAVRSELEKAVELFNGDLLPICYDDWIISQREVLSQAFLCALERLVYIQEEQLNYQEAIVYAQRLLRHDPLRESTYRLLIRLHALNGDRANALRVYHTCTTILQRELDVEPSAATREAYEQILGMEVRTYPAIPTAVAYSPLVGREREWAQMIKAWRHIVSGCQPHAVILCGEAGIGKTRLLEDLLLWAARQGITNTIARCYAAEGDLAYSPVTAWLRSRPLPPLDDVWLAEVARLLPETYSRRPELPRPAALKEAWQRQHLFEALSRAILGNKQPLLLAIDDLQWCDRDTLEWLHFLLRFNRDARYLVIGAYRLEEITDNHPLESLLQALRLDGQVIELELQTLDEISTHTLAMHILGSDIDHEDVQRLYQETEGNPLFVVETLRVGFRILDPKLKRPEHSPTRKIILPPKVQTILEARLSQLTPPSRELAGLAAIIGREFSSRLLAKSSGLDESTFVQQLDELWQRRIVREHGVEAYDFSHDKLREVAYNTMSMVHRRLLHTQVAQALEALHSSDMSSVCHQVAVHYERAGLPEKAIPYYLRAAKAAIEVCANDDAITILQHGLSLAHEVQPTAGGPISNQIAQLSEALGDILLIKAQYEDALKAYKNSQSQILSTNSLNQARLYRKEGAVIREQRLYITALDALQQAETMLGKQPDQDDNLWWDEWLEVQVERVWARYWLAQWQEMEEIVNKVQPVIQKRGNPTDRLRFLWASCLMHLRRERYRVSDEMLSDAREALALSQKLNNLKTRLEFTFELGFLHLWRFEFDEAEKFLQDALYLADTSGFMQIQTLSLTYLTVLKRFKGEDEEVIKYAQKAFHVAEAATMPDYIAASKSNLAWLAWRRQDLDTARQESLEALAIWQESPLVYPFQWQALWPLVSVSLVQCQEAEAFAYAKALLAASQQLLPDELNIHLIKAMQSNRMDQENMGRYQLQLSMEVASKIGYL